MLRNDPAMDFKRADENFHEIMPGELPLEKVIEETAWFSYDMRNASGRIEVPLRSSLIFLRRVSKPGHMALQSK